MAAKFADATRDGNGPPVHAELPGLGYPRPFRYVPHPFESLRVLAAIRRMGASKLAVCGVANDPQLVPFDVNREAMRRWMQDPDTEAAVLIESIAGDWVGAGHAPSLVSAWRDADEGWSFRPLWSHFGWQKQLLPGPLVPDPLNVDRAELAYFDSAALRKQDEIIGAGALIPHERDESLRSHVLRVLYPRSFDLLNSADAKLAGLSAKLDGPAKDVVTAQREAVQLALLVLRHQHNWYEAGCYLDPGDAPEPARTFAEIMDDELDVTRRLVNLLDGRAGQFLALFPYDFMVYEYGAGIVGQLRDRIEVMERHRHDPVRPVSKQTARTRAHDASYAPIKE